MVSFKILKIMKEKCFPHCKSREEDSVVLLLRLFFFYKKAVFVNLNCKSKL